MHEGKKSFLLRQIIVSLIVLVAAFFGWLFFVPDAAPTLARYGVALPFGPTAEAAQAAPGAEPRRGPGGGPGGPGGGRFGGANRNASVITQPVGVARINDSLTAIGEGIAAHSATVTTPSGGTLVALDVAPGDTVAAGAVVGQLDAEAEEIALDKARLAVTDAEATLKRTTELARTNSATAVAVSTAQLALDTANLELRNAELALKRRSITAPIAGTIGLMQVTPGNYVANNVGVTTVDDTSDIKVTFWVPERYAAQIRLGMPVEASAVALPGRSFTGEISALDNRIDSASRTLEVQATIPNDSQDMRAGMSFSVTMRFPGQDFPAVNPLAIQWSAEGSYVWRLEDGKARKVMTRIIQRNSDGVLVDGDLAEGQPIITEGVLQVQEGMEVTVLGAQPEAETQPPAASGAATQL